MSKSAWSARSTSQGFDGCSVASPECVLHSEPYEGPPRGLQRLGNAVRRRIVEGRQEPGAEPVEGEPVEGDDAENEVRYL